MMTLTRADPAQAGCTLEQKASQFKYVHCSVVQTPSAFRLVMLAGFKSSLFDLSCWSSNEGKAVIM